MRADLTALSRRGVLGAATAALLTRAASAATNAERWLPIDLQGGLLLTTGTINGQPVHVMLDSGAGVIVVDTKVAARLGLKGDGEMKLTGTSDSLQAARIGGFSMMVGGVPISVVPSGAVASDLSLFGATGLSIDVILGRDIFESLMIDLDLPRSRYAFRPLQPFIPLPGAFPTPVNAEPGLQHSTPVSVDGRPVMKALFDLGSGLPLEVSGAYARREGLLKGLKTSTWVAGSIDGIRSYITATLPALTIGKTTLHNVPLGVTEDWEDGNMQAVVGLPVWNRFRIQTRYAERQLWLTPDAAGIRRPFRKERAGLAGLLDAGALKVLHVAPGSPAQAAGWTVGERILKIDGEAIRPDYGRSVQSDWNKGDAGRTVSLTTPSGERRLTLADYY